MGAHKEVVKMNKYTQFTSGELSTLTTKIDSVNKYRAFTRN